MNILTRRMLVCVITGAILGIVCIVGAQLRSGFTTETYYLFSFWGKLNTAQAIGRGALLGLLVSFAFYSSTDFRDVIGFIAGIIYGVIIEYAALKLGGKTS